MLWAQQLREGPPGHALRPPANMSANRVRVSRTPSGVSESVNSYTNPLHSDLLPQDEDQDPGEFEHSKKVGMCAQQKGPRPFAYMLAMPLLFSEVSSQVRAWICHHTSAGLDCTCLHSFSAGHLPHLPVGSCFCATGTARQMLSCAAMHAHLSTLQAQPTNVSSWNMSDTYDLQARL